MKLEDLVKLEDHIREIKTAGASSTITFTMKISALEYLLRLARQEHGEDNVVQFRTIDNLTRYKPETIRTRTYRSWQDPSVKKEFAQRYAKRKAAKKEKQLQSEKLNQAWQNYAGNHKKQTA